jgi:hypothetical protein
MYIINLHNFDQHDHYQKKVLYITTIFLFAVVIGVGISKIFVLVDITT